MKIHAILPRSATVWLVIHSIFLFVLCITQVSAQDSGGINITGKIVSLEDSEGLPGVTVLVKGTLQGTVSDAEGNYSINVPDNNAILVFSFVGSVPEEIRVGVQTVLDIGLAEDIESLEEVVVVGYGVQKKINLSGAVNTIDADRLRKRPVTRISQGLQGVSPNLNIDFPSGEPGAAAKINIRGITSINGGDPLILIDGVPSDGTDLNNLNPRDVADITVLKDASSAAIYGARAAYGVLLITTKTGSSKGISVSYGNNFSWTKPTQLQEINTDPYIKTQLYHVANDNTIWGDFYRLPQERLEWARDRSDDPSVEDTRVNETTGQYEYMGNTNWSEQLFGEPTFSQQHSLQIDGASDKVRYYVSGAYDKENGILKIADDYFDRMSLRTKVDFQPTEWLKVGVNNLMSKTDRVKPGYFPNALLFRQLTWMNSTDVAKNPDGTYADRDWWNAESGAGHNFSKLENGGTESTSKVTNQTTFTAQANLWGDRLKINSDFTFRNRTENTDGYTLKYMTSPAPGVMKENGTEEAWRRALTKTYTVFNLYTTYNETFGNHEVTALVGVNQEVSKTDQFYASQFEFISASLPNIGLATGAETVGQDWTDWAVKGSFFRLNYIFNRRYIVEFNGRYDGTSKFEDGKRFGFFPSASAAWNVDQEAFMRPLDNVISTFKLRGSYGTLGNQNVLDENGQQVNYGYVPLMQARKAAYIIGGQLPLRVSAPPLVSPNYSWEQVSTLNFGVDVGFLDGKLNVNFDMYQRETAGMLTPGLDLPDVLGADEPNENAADLITKGWEVALDYRDNFSIVGKPASFGARVTLADSRAWITKFDNPSRSLADYYVGQEFGELWGFESDGLFKSQEEIDQLNQKELQAWGMDFRVGGVKWVDQDGNGIIEKGTTVGDPKDGKIIGNTSIRFRYGVNLDLSWNGFDISAFFQGVGRKDYYPTQRAYWGMYSDPFGEDHPFLWNFYRGEDDPAELREQHSKSYIAAGLADQNLDSELPLLMAWSYLGNSYENGTGLGIPQSAYLKNAAYTRLKNLTIGYTLPNSITKNKFRNLRVYVSGENIATWSRMTFIDPEEVTSTAHGNVYPFRKRLSFGLNVDF